MCKYLIYGFCFGSNLSKICHHSIFQITPKERKNKLHVKMESTMYEQPIRDAGGKLNYR